MTLAGIKTPLPTCTLRAAHIVSTQRPPQKVLISTISANLMG